MRESAAIRTALAAATDDRIFFDLTGIEGQYAALLRELPGISVRFAMKACPVDEVLACLARLGAGFDAAGPNEIEQALRTGVPRDRIHYGNTIKSDENIADAYRLGVRDFATDSVEDVAAIARHAPGSRVFCRLATSGEGALWGLSQKFGCSAGDAVRVLEAARDAGLVPSGLSVHVGSQQMTAEAWRGALDDLTDLVAVLGGRGILLDRINLGGGLPALGCLDRAGRPSILRSTRSSPCSAKAWSGCARNRPRPWSSSWNPGATSSPTTAPSGPAWPGSRPAADATASAGTGSI